MNNPPRLVAKKLQVVPEKTIRQASKDPLLDGEPNSFIYALESGKVFKDNDLTPVYLLEHNTMTIYVTSKQHLKKMFH
jgi:hypothetical protein